MSYEQTIQILEMSGLSRSDSEIYLYLLVHGHKKAINIADTIGKPLGIVYFSLRQLRAKGIITVFRDRALFYCASPIEELLDKQSSLELENVKEIIQRKKKIVKKWISFLNKLDI